MGELEEKREKATKQKTIVFRLLLSKNDGGVTERNRNEKTLFMVETVLFAGIKREIVTKITADVPW